MVIGVCKAEVNIICGDKDIDIPCEAAAGGWRPGNTCYIETNDARPDWGRAQPPVASYFISRIVGV